MRFIHWLPSLLVPLCSVLAATPDAQVGGGLRDVVDDAVDDILEGVQQVGSFLREEVHRTFLAGNILPTLNKLFITPEKFQRIITTVGEVSDWQDVFFLLTLAFGVVPLVRLPYNSIVKGMNKFEDSLYHVVADNLQQVSRIALVCYLVDLLKVVVIEMGFVWEMLPHIPNLFAKFVYTIWFARRLGVLKKWFLCKAWQKRPDQLGRMELIDHLADAVIVLLVGLSLADQFKNEFGFALKSLLALGSVGTLVFSLASQGIVANLMNGLLLAASDRVYEGDSVLFGNGIEGVVVDLGWLETHVRQNDEIMLTVPNSDLASERLSNLSRLTKCQVRQVLRIDYKDVKKLPKLCDDIKSEIRASCPALIADGSRPFRAHWVGYEDLSLNVVVEAHFAIRPLGDGYWDNRQKVLEAISRAVEKNDVTFVTTD
ncbi:mechanosensitive ion channel [Fragilaria crotonensis]|nr:mechanosensitive ion channel [Fragilaria crotonensis]